MFWVFGGFVGAVLLVPRSQLSAYTGRAVTYPPVKCFQVLDTVYDMDANNLQLDKPSDIHTPVIPLLGGSNKCSAFYDCAKGLLRARLPTPMRPVRRISDHQQSWEYEDGLWKGPGPTLPVAADF